MIHITAMNSLVGQFRKVQQRGVADIKER